MWSDRDQTGSLSSFLRARSSCSGTSFCSVLQPADVIRHRCKQRALERRGRLLCCGAFPSRRPVRTAADAKAVFRGRFQRKVSINERLLDPTQKPAAVGELSPRSAASATLPTLQGSWHGVEVQHTQVSGGGGGWELTAVCQAVTKGEGGLAGGNDPFNHCS